MITNIEDTEIQAIKSSKTGAVFTLARNLTQQAGLGEFSVMHETLLPGHRTSSPHYHTHLDEMYLVLEGEPTLFWRVIDSLCGLVIMSFLNMDQEKSI